MAEAKNGCAATGAFKEAVCIDVGRIYDSCCDRDCLEDLRCFFKPCDKEAIECAKTVRAKGAEVMKVFVDVEPINFNKGFFNCSLTFFFLVEFDLFVSPHSRPITIRGVAYFEKKVILFGGEGNVKIFSNQATIEDESDRQDCPTNNLPKCVVQTVDPIALSARICEIREADRCNFHVPDCVCECLGGNPETDGKHGELTIYVTLGLFTIVQLIRRTQLLVPVYDFCIPDKQCIDTSDHPCDVFKKIQFPVNDFFPKRPCHIKEDGCDCCFKGSD